MVCLYLRLASEASLDLPPQSGRQTTSWLSSEQLKQYAAAGQLVPTDQVWKEGMAAWMPAAKLSGLFAAAAPALPTAASLMPPSSTESVGNTASDGTQAAPKSSFFERAKAGAAGLAATAKAAAQLTAKQAERTKINQSDLPLAYTELGRQVHAAGNFRQEFEAIYQKIDKVLGDIQAIQSRSQSAPAAEGFADKAKAAAHAAKDATQVKGMQLLLRNDYRDLGKAVYEKHGEQSSVPATVQPIKDALARIATLDAEIAQLSDAKSGRWLTPKRFAIAAAVLLVIGLAAIGKSQKAGSTTTGGTPTSATSGGALSAPKNASAAYKEGYSRTFKSGQETGLGLNRNVERINSAVGWSQKNRDREISGLIAQAVESHRNFLDSIPEHLPKSSDPYQTMQGVADGYRDGFNSTCTVYQLR